MRNNKISNNKFINYSIRVVVGILKFSLEFISAISSKISKANIGLHFDIVRGN